MEKKNHITLEAKKKVIKYPERLDTTFLCPVWEAPKTIQTIAIPPHYSTELADKTLLKIPYTSVSRHRLIKLELIWKSGSFLLTG